ncbi:MAG: hypothetical protein ACXV6K_10560 [Halobacteriota archaeon]
MRKRLLVIVICAVMLSATVVTSAVSAAKQAGQSDVRQYDVRARYTQDVVVGKLTVDFENRHYVIDANWGKATTLPDGTDYKDFIKGFAPHAGTINAANGAHSIEFGSIIYNKGGTAHGEGTLDKTTLDWLKTYGDGATFITYRVYS